MGVRRLFVCGDILNPELDKEIAGGKRLDPGKLTTFLRKFLGRRMEIAAASTAAAQRTYAGFAENFFASAGRPYNTTSWIKLYDATPNPRQIALARAVFENSLIIGYELSPIFLRTLSKAGLKWLDFEPHPGRHIVKSAIGLRSNIQGIKHLLKPCLLKDQQIMQATIEFQKAGIDISAPAYENIALFVDEYANHRGRIQGGKRHLLEEFENEIKNILAQYDRVIVVPVKDSFAESAEMYLTMLYPKTSKSTQNFLQLVSLPQVKAVYTLNSDKALTALYFGKPGYSLMPYQYGFSDTVITEKTCIGLREEKLPREFWNNLIRSLYPESSGESFAY